ncbi:MAG: hypothetical protein ACOC1P_04635, partial [Minisyncoccales bacterium]
MEDDKRGKMSLKKKVLRKIIALLIVFFVVIVSGFFVADANGFFVNTCGDGTFPGECSEDKPYYCNSHKILVKNASECGCPEVLNYSEGVCFSKYETGEDIRNFEYYLHGKKESIEMEV